MNGSNLIDSTIHTAWIRKACVLGAAPLILVASAAMGSGDGVSVKITNDGTEDIVVTVYDMTVGPNAVVLSHAHINGFTSVPVSVAPDANGRANLAWTAITTDPRDRKCGHEEVAVGDSSTVSVHADSSCET
jgi:hypothetical protein